MAALLSVLTGLANGLLDLIMLPWTVWQWFHIEVLKERMIALTLGGMSVEFLYMILSLVLVLLVISLFSRRFLETTVLSLESFNRKIGQLACWFVLLLMFQQVLIIIMGQVFRGNELLISPFGMQLSNAELQWLSGQLKLYNAVLIAFASAYTFIEGGHVRVDLVYGNLGYRAKRLIDFLGSILFMMPATILLWWFAWPLSMNALFAQRPMNIFSEKASWRGLRLETSGTAEFTWVWAFKVLILVFAALLFIQAVAFMLRNLWALLDASKEIDAHPSDPDEPPEAVPDINLGNPNEPPVLSQYDADGHRSTGKTDDVDAYLTTHARAGAQTLEKPAAHERSVPLTSRDYSSTTIAAPSLAPAGGHNKQTGGR